MTSEAESVPVQAEREEAGLEITENVHVEHDEADGTLSVYEDDKVYTRLLKEINCQNHILELIKGQIRDIICKPCTSNEQNDLKRYYVYLEHEMQKSRCLINEAMKLQNFGFRGHYKEIPLVTTFDEDNMAHIHSICENMQVSIKQERGPCLRESSDETSELQKTSCQETATQDHHICACGSSSKKGTESLEKLKDKIKCMQQTMDKLKDAIFKREFGKKSSSICPDHQTQQKPYSAQQTPIDPDIQCPVKKQLKAEKLQTLEENYLYLLTEFSKKDEQLKQLTKKIKTTCGCSGGAMNDGNADKSELYLLRNRVNEMKQEQVEFKCLMREQSLQLEDYRNKYLSAQQRVEEQCALMEKLNMNNKRIEKQINFEIKEIRARFQEKLKELLQYPKLLENEQIKLSQTCKEKEELESKLAIVCKELKNVQMKMEKKLNGEDCKPQLQRCQLELGQVKKNMEEIQRQRDLFCEQLRTTVEDLDTLRTESAMIIARTKERTELLKQQQQEHIDRLEKQLAQCRATACLSVRERETVIREMQGQLNTMSYSFDAAQKQIKTLRNHITYMSNENCFPAKC